MPQTATVVCHPEARDVAQPKRRVLLVDDSDSLRKMLTLVLKNNGFEVAAASNVNDALKLIAAETFRRSFERPAYAGRQRRINRGKRHAAFQFQNGYVHTQWLSGNG
jgi:CheY-like chemotaxis protein